MFPFAFIIVTSSLVLPALTLSSTSRGRQVVGSLHGPQSNYETMLPVGLGTWKIPVDKTTGIVYEAIKKGKRMVDHDEISLRP
jgi:hypothetical protein